MSKPAARTCFRGRRKPTFPASKRLRTVYPLLVALLLSALAGCRTSPDPAPEKALSLARLTPEKRAWVERLRSQALKRMVRLRASPTQIGSGCVIASDGWVLTAAHVVGSAKRVDAVLPSGVRMPARVVLINRTNDYALLKLDALGLLYFETAPPPPQGATVLALGAWKLPHTAQASVGKVVYPSVRIPGERGAYYFDAVFHTAPIVPGDSGGALLDRHGRLVGVHGGFTGRASSVAAAWETIHRQVFERPGGPRDLTDLALRFPAGSHPAELAGVRPRDFAQSARWTLESITPTLLSLYGPQNENAVRAVIEQTERRYLSLREVDRRDDDALIRAMLEALFEALEERLGTERTPLAATKPGALSSFAAARARVRSRS